MTKTETKSRASSIKKPRGGLPKKHPKKKSPWKIALIVIAVLLVIGVVSGIIMYSACYEDISNRPYEQKQKTQVISSDSQVIAELFERNQTYVSLSQVPKDLQNALIATEDSRFYEHGGIDPRGIMRSLVSNIIGGDATGQGASTLTQQLARLLYLDDISTEDSTWDSIKRKVSEISIAFQLEKKYTKDQILEMYLNEYFFGSSAYGVEEAAKTYFGKDVSQLNLAECAMIAGLPQAPSAYAPNSDFEAAKNRQKQVLDRMVATGYITQEQADAAYNTELTIIPQDQALAAINNQITPGYEEYVQKALNTYAEYAAPTYMKQNNITDQDQAEEEIRDNLASGGYKIYTSIDTRFQNDAIETATATIENYGLDTRSEPVDEYPGEDVAIVSVDRDGAVKAYFGGVSDVDMADTPLQPGSNAKPLYYSGVFEKGILSPNDTVLDKTEDFGGGYTPHNYGGSESGRYVTLQQALINSLNVPSVRVFQAFGVENAMEWIQSFGISTIVTPEDNPEHNDYNLAAATGGWTQGVKPLEMAAAFNVFNNGGIYNEPYFITKIETTAGNAVFDKSEMGLDTHRVMSENTASTMWGILRQGVTSGTGGAAAQSLPTAGKTGTTDNEENLWFSGMTSNITTSVWVGSRNYDPTGLSSAVAAGTYGSYMSTLINNGVVTQDTGSNVGANSAASASTSSTTNTTPTPEPTTAPEPTAQTTVTPTPEPEPRPEPTPEQDTGNDDTGNNTTDNENSGQEVPQQ